MQKPWLAFIPLAGASWSSVACSDWQRFYSIHTVWCLHAHPNNSALPLSPVQHALRSYAWFRQAALAPTHAKTSTDIHQNIFKMGVSLNQNKERLKILSFSYIMKWLRLIPADVHWFLSGECGQHRYHWFSWVSSSWLPVARQGCSWGHVP